MEALETIWKAAVLIISGILLLRVAGRKSISQMTLAQTIVMISIGAIIIQPILDQSIWRTLLASATFVVALLLMEWLQVKFNFMENFLTGKAKTVIENGQPVVENLKKLRFTVDQMEMRLRQQGIKKISDVKTATLEPNGQLGYELMRHAQPLTIGEFEKIMGSFITQQQQNDPQPSPNIFDEVSQKGHPRENLEKLQ